MANDNLIGSDPEEIDENSQNYQKKNGRISKLIGGIGKWQIYWIIILTFYEILSTFQIFSFTFQSAQKDFWCARPSNDMDTELWRNITQPEGSCSILNFTTDQLADNNFRKYFQGFTTDFNLNISNMALRPCKQYEYAENEIGFTLVEEWDLVCEQKNILSVVEMCFLAGAAVGSICSGWISDKFGRKHTLMIFATIQASIGTLLAFSNSLIMFMLLRTINGFASMTVTCVSFVLVLELVSGKYRTIIGILNILPVSLSYTLNAGIAYLTQDWRLLQLVISVPCFALLFIWYCVPESPRWLLAQGRINQLDKLIKRASQMNGRVLPINYLKTLESECSKNTKSNLIKSNPLIIVLSKKYLRTTILTLISWFSLIILYFGLTLHLSNLGGNIYLNAAISGLIEAASVLSCIYIVLKTGIRKNIITYMIISGTACIMVNVVPNGNLWAVILLAMIGKCLMGANNAIIPTFTAQQYPTVVRNFGIGLGNLAAGIALILVPYVWLLEHYQIYLPMTVLGILGLIGAGSLSLMKDNINE